MCGSLLSKFKTSRNKPDPAMKIFPEPRGVASKINTVRAVEPLSSTGFTLSLKRVKNAVAFDIPVGDKKVCPPARISRRFRKQKVAPKRTLGDVKKKLRDAEERRLKELRRIQEIAQISSGLEVSQPYPHPAEIFAQATAAKIAAKQAAAEKKRNEELEKKQAGKRASRNRRRIVAAKSSIKMSEEEEEIHANLQDLDTYHDSDEDANDHGWEDFFPD